jgi:hypothetical protein
MRVLPLFVPSLGFALAALVASGLALEGRREAEAEEVVVGNRAATLVAVVAAVLCVLSLLAACRLRVIHQLAATGD